LKDGVNNIFKQEKGQNAKYSAVLFIPYTLAYYTDRFPARLIKYGQ